MSENPLTVFFGVVSVVSLILQVTHVLPDRIKPINKIVTVFGFGALTAIALNLTLVAAVEMHPLRIIFLVGLILFVFYIVVCAFLYFHEKYHSKASDILLVSVFIFVFYCVMVFGVFDNTHPNNNKIKNVDLIILANHYQRNGQYESATRILEILKDQTSSSRRSAIDEKINKMLQEHIKKGEDYIVIDNSTVDR
jgi:ABC-type multidrug transport system fused ATPase/permease subunit